ncbi:DMT family transporter [Hyphococcus formosus]|uniref:DMT family transporter n=1 Tax=Hyphococcus formosus TaxID=3143534 RepID=UPI00398AE900
MSSNLKSPKEATPFDWVLLTLIVAFGGSAFVMIRSALETIPPPIVAAGRIWVGAALLYILMRAAGRRLPPFFSRAHGHWHIRRSWRWMIAVGAVGNVIPFFIFPWAQQYVESGLAGIYMAFMPIWTVALAYFFAGENLSGRKIIGFGLGFLGVIILMGPEVISGALSSDFRAQLALLLATLLYAASAVLSRRAPPIRPRIFAAGMMIVAAVMATPAFFLVNLDADQWSLTSILSVVGLGVFPTGLNGVIIIMLIRRAGAGFMALSNYITPVWAVAMGALIYHERLDLSAIVALTFILIGVAISQRSPFDRKSKNNTALAGEIAGEIKPMVEKTTPAETDQTKS